MKVWFCYMNSGGGHKAPAQALAKAMQELRGREVQPELINLAEGASFFLRFLMESGYTWLIHNAPKLYALVYELSLTRPIIAVEHKLGVLFLKKKFVKKIAAEKPDRIVSTFFLIEALVEAMKELQVSIPLTVVVTEPYSTPPVWFYSKQLPYVVFSERAKKIAERCEAKNVTVMPPIVNNELRHELSPEEKNEWRKKIGLHPAKKIVLVIGGGAGLPEGEKIIAEFVKTNMDVQFVIVCGKNKRFENRVRRILAKTSQETHLFSFVDFVPELIALADLVVTKAGAGVAAEIMVQHKPLLITHYIYGQEKGTMEYVVENGFGWYASKPKEARQVLEKYFTDERARMQVRESYTKKQIISGTKQLAEYLLR